MSILQTRSTTVRVMTLLVVVLLAVCASTAATISNGKDYHSLLEANIFWDNSIDQELSQSLVFKRSDWEILLKKVRTQHVVRLEKGCGRPKNMLATLEDGTKVCCRYREHQIKELRGDVYSYYFNTLLELWNVPPSVLVHVDFSSQQWKQVLNEALQVGWIDNSEVVMTFYVHDLTEVYIPSLLRDSTTNLTLEAVEKAALSRKEKLHLAQWSDMIVHDFIIGHTDRLFNTLFNLQWNPIMMQVAVHNLKQTSVGQLVLLDNESGFWMGYSLNDWDPSKYEYQIHFLNQVCVFRKSTIEKIINLSTINDNGLKLDVTFERFIESHDEYSFNTLQKLNSVHRQEFTARISTVLHHIQACVNA